MRTRGRMQEHRPRTMKVSVGPPAAAAGGRARARPTDKTGRMEEGKDDRVEGEGEGGWWDFKQGDWMGGVRRDAFLPGIEGEEEGRGRRGEKSDRQQEVGDGCKKTSLHQSPHPLCATCIASAATTTFPFFSFFWKRKALPFAPAAHLARILMSTSHSVWICISTRH